MIPRNTDVFIGQAGTGTSREYFTGMIDEVKIYSRSLAHAEVLDIFRSTPHNGGHCENNAKHTHCKKEGSDYCDAAMAHQVGDLGQAHTNNPKTSKDTSKINKPGTGCNIENALAPDGKVAGLGYPAGSGYAMWDGHAVTSCLELDFAREFQADGIKFAAAATDERLCGVGDTCVGKYCGTGGTFLVFASGANRASLTDYTTFRYQGSAKVAVDKKSGNGVAGQMNFDEMQFKQGQQAVKYVAVCRGGGGGARDNIVVDWVALRATAKDYQATGNHCDPKPPPPPPPLGTAFVKDYYFFVNCFDGQSWDPVQARWEDVSTISSVPPSQISRGVASGLEMTSHPVARTATNMVHFVASPLPKHFEFDGKQHFEFTHPEAFDFAGAVTTIYVVVCVSATITCDCVT
jgi:hypothetical protein